MVQKMSSRSRHCLLTSTKNKEVEAKVEGVDGEMEELSLMNLMNYSVCFTV